MQVLLAFLSFWHFAGALAMATESFKNTFFFIIKERKGMKSHDCPAILYGDGVVTSLSRCGGLWGTAAACLLSRVRVEMGEGA